MIIDSKAILKQLLSSTNLARAQAFCILEFTKVIIVSKNEKLVFVAFEVVALSFKNLNNG